MMEKPLLSIVVPVYNTAEYVGRCLDSILMQGSLQYEIVIVDDGSTDGSAEICDEVAKRHKNVEVIHQRNGGVSSARNCGIDSAKGEYLWFVDSDDRILPGALARLLEVLANEKPELVVFPVVQEDSSEKRKGLIPAPHRADYKTCGPLQAGDLLYPYAHVMSRCIIGEERFDTGLALLEDRDFLYRVCSSVSSDVLILEEPLYAYLITREESAVNSSRVDKYVAANVVQEKILSAELAAGRLNPAYEIYAGNTLGVLSLISRTKECEESFEPLRQRLLSFDAYSYTLVGKPKHKYRLCKLSPRIFKMVYFLYGKLKKRNDPGTTVLVEIDNNSTGDDAR